MPEYTNERINTFYGLNNLLNPASPAYREGMASRSLRSRIDEQGLWTAQQDIMAHQGAIARVNSPSGGGSHYKFLTVNDTPTVVDMVVGVSCDVGPNKRLYSTNGSGAIKNVSGSVVALTPPVISTLTMPADAGNSRAEDGVYHYMVTFYDTVNQRESLPSAVKSVDYAFVDTTNEYVLVTLSAAATTAKPVRIYRSRRTNADDGAYGVYNATNKFYFLGELTSGNTFKDYLHDSETANYLYEGRGSAPPTDVDYLVSFNNRMLYFKGSWLYWSSAGRPEEVPQSYTLTYDSPTDSVLTLPRLTTGIYGEAKYEIGELSGHKVLAAMPINGKLYVWTATQMGVITATTRLEGYRYKKLYDGVGVTSDKVLALSPYGLFGADGQGIWLMTISGTVRRLTDGVIDLRDSGSDTYFTSTDFTNSFGCWVQVLNEYWFGVSGKIIAYQANRGTFVGPYNYSIHGATAFANSSGPQIYSTIGTPNPAVKDSVSRTLEFWLGQSTPTTVKDQLQVEIAQSAAAQVTAAVIQNSFPSATGANGSVSESITDAVGRVSPDGSGRLFRLLLTTTQAASKLAVISYKYNAIGWTKKAGR